MTFDPYHKWLGIAPKDQPPNHYRLLAIEVFESDPDVIDAAANRQMSYLQQRAHGKHAALSQKLLNEIAAARVCLLNPKKKAEYDAELRVKLAETTQGEEKPKPDLSDIEPLPAINSLPLPSVLTPLRPALVRRIFRPKLWHYALAIGVVSLLGIGVWAAIMSGGKPDERLAATEAIQPAALHEKEAGGSPLKVSDSDPSTNGKHTDAGDEPSKPSRALSSIRLSVSDLTEWGVYLTQKPLAELVKYDEANDCARFVQQAPIYNMRLAEYDRYTLTFQYRRPKAAEASLWLQDHCTIRFGSADGSGALHARMGKSFTPLAGQRVESGSENGDILVRVLPMQQAEKEAEWNDVRLERDLKRWTITINGRIVQEAECSVSQPRPFTVHGPVGFEFRNVEITPLPSTEP